MIASSRPPLPNQSRASALQQQQLLLRNSSESALVGA